VNERLSTIETERLRLVVLLPEEVEALIAGDTERAGHLAGVVFPPGWPDEAEAMEGLPWHLRHLLADAAQIPWRIRVIVERSTSTVVGSINLKGPPSDTGTSRWAGALSPHVASVGMPWKGQWRSWLGPAVKRA
jgi:hypothetical protein